MQCNPRAIGFTARFGSSSCNDIRPSLLPREMHSPSVLPAYSKCRGTGHSPYPLPYASRSNVWMHTTLCTATYLKYLAPIHLRLDIWQTVRKETLGYPEVRQLPTRTYCQYAKISNSNFTSEYRPFSRGTYRQACSGGKYAGSVMHICLVQAKIGVHTRPIRRYVPFPPSQSPGLTPPAVITWPCKPADLTQIARD